MSSPIHHAKDLDAALIYAPPWAREQRQPEPLRPAAALAVGSPQRRRRLGLAGTSYSGDLAMAKLQRQLALEPDTVPEPPLDDLESLWPIALRLSGVAGVAAAVAWLMVSLPGAKLLRNDTMRTSVPAAPIAVHDQKQDPLHSASAVALLVQHGLAEATTPPPQPETPPAAEDAPTTQAPGNVFMPDNKSLLLGTDEITTLVNRGKDFLTNGDLAAARLLLRRAADAGSAEAALALGATFDPLVIQRLKAVGAAPDIDRARQWYQKAMELGSTAASQQLAKLAQARQ
jgi:hypothetical protein